MKQTRCRGHAFRNTGTWGARKFRFLVTDFEVVENRNNYGQFRTVFNRLCFQKFAK